MALNVERRSAARLTGELDWNQAAPLAFLELEKAMTVLFGTSEYVLRFAPLVASLVALVVFTRVALKILDGLAAVVAVFVFAGVALVTSYAAVAKPYSFDVLIALVLYLLTLRVLRTGNSYAIAALTIMGIIAPLFSFASVFVVAACGTILLLHAFFSGSRRTLVAVVTASGIWLTLLLILYEFHGRTTSQIRRSLPHETITSFGSARDAVGSLRQVLGVSAHTNHLGYGNGLGFSVATAAAVFAALFIIVGTYQLLRHQWRAGALLLLPGIYASIGSAASWYPLFPRAILFLAPTLAILIAAGFCALLAQAGHFGVRILVIGMFVTVSVAQIASTVNGIEAVREDEGMKPVMSLLAGEQEDDDTVYLDFASQYTFAYYIQCGCADAKIARATHERLWDVTSVPGSPDQWAPALRSPTNRLRIANFRGYGLDGYYADFARLPRNERVWVVLAGLRPEQRRTLAAWLDRRGERLAEHHESGDVMAISALLYKF